MAQKSAESKRGAISRAALQRLFVLSILGKFSHGCFGHVRLQKVVYGASKLSPLKPFEFKKHHYGQYSDDLATVLEQLLSMGYVSASPLQGGSGNSYRVARRDLTRYFETILRHLAQDAPNFIERAVQEYGYLPEQQLVGKAYQDPVLQQAKQRETILKPNISDRVEVPGLTEKECDQIELAMCPSFVTAMSILAAGLRESKLDLSKVKKVAKAL